MAEYLEARVSRFRDHPNSQNCKAHRNLCYEPRKARQVGDYFRFRSMKRLGVFLYSPLDGMLVHPRVIPSIFAGTHLYTWVSGERHRESKVSCPRTQNAPGQKQTRATRATRFGFGLDLESSTLTKRPPRLPH